MPQANKRTIQFIPPMECLPVDHLPEGDEWVYELKLDGYRSEGIRDTDGVRILSRNGNDVSKKYPRVVAALGSALMKQTVVDGELVAFDDGGRPSFNVMQNAGQGTHVVFFVFDILVDRGRDVKALPLSSRRSLLETVVVFSDLVPESGVAPGERSGSRLGRNLSWADSSSAALESILWSSASMKERSCSTRRVSGRG